MSNRAKFRIGIDIGSNCLKLVSFHPKKKVSLLRLGLIDFLKDEKVQHPKEVDETHIMHGIQNLINDLPFKKASIRICLSASLNNLFVVNIPQVGRQELKQVLFWELVPFLPEPVKNYEYDYKLLHHDHKKKQMTILIGVYNKARLERILKVFKGLGKDIDILDTDSLPALDLFLTETGEIKESIGFLQLGANHCNYSIISPESAPSFLFIPFGGNTLNALIAGSKKFSYLAAETYRRETLITEGNSEANLVNAFKNFASIIIRFNIHHQYKTGYTLSKIVVTGGLLNDPFVFQTLKKSPGLFQVPSEFWDPVNTYFPDDMIKQDHRFHFASALGLALR